MVYFLGFLLIVVGVYFNYTPLDWIVGIVVVSILYFSAAIEDNKKPSKSKSEVGNTHTNSKIKPPELCRYIIWDKDDYVDEHHRTLAFDSKWGHKPIRELPEFFLVEVKNDGKSTKPIYGSNNIESIFTFAHKNLGVQDLKFNSPDRKSKEHEKATKKAESEAYKLKEQQCEELLLEMGYSFLYTEIMGYRVWKSRSFEEVFQSYLLDDVYEWASTAPNLSKNP